MGKQSSVNQGFSIQKLFEGLDIQLSLLILALVVFGLVVLYSASMPLGIAGGYPPIMDVLDQARWVLLGLVAAFVISFIDYRKLSTLSLWMLIFAIVSLVLVLVIGTEIHGAKRTLFNGRVQPSEITKVILILYLGFWLTSKQEYLKKITLWAVPLGVLIGLIAALLYKEPDFSALLTILIITGLLLFIAHIDWWQTLIIGGLGVLAFLFVIRFTGTGSVRWMQFQDGWRDPSQAISQVQRTFESIVDGGLFGVGIGQGTVKFTGLEVGQTDTIFTIVAEEMGLVGIFVLLTLFVLLMIRGLKIALSSKEQSGQLIASGIIFWIIAETFLNIASLINLIPIGGNTLPMFSKGGSSLVSVLIGLGFVLSVARVNHVNKSNERSSHSAVVDMRWRDRGRSVSGPSRSANIRKPTR